MADGCCPRSRGLGLSPSPGHARVSIDIGIHFPAPPPLIVVPGTPVMYAPEAPANYFYYAGRYYVFTGDTWYVSDGYNGPWFVVAPEFVPGAILAVPVGYYRVPPPAWHGWRREAPPHWETRSARRWGEHREQLDRRHQLRSLTVWWGWTAHRVET